MSAFYHYPYSFFIALTFYCPLLLLIYVRPTYYYPKMSSLPLSKFHFFFIWFCGFFLFCSKNIFEIFFIPFIYFYAQNPNKTKFLKNLSKTSIIPVFFTHPVYLYNIVFRPECPGRYPKVQDGVYQGADRETRKRVP